MKTIVAVLDPACRAVRPSRASLSWFELADQMTIVEAIGAGLSDAESAGDVVIHTGFWGCGAYGGNRELMAALQIIAARSAGITRLVFHSFDDDGMDSYRAGEAVADAFAELRGVDMLIAAFVELGFEWGVSDGN